MGKQRAFPASGLAVRAGAEGAGGPWASVEPQAAWGQGDTLPKSLCGTSRDFHKALSENQHIWELLWASDEKGVPSMPLGPQPSLPQAAHPADPIVGAPGHSGQYGLHHGECEGITAPSQGPCAPVGLGQPPDRQVDRHTGRPTTQICPMTPQPHDAPISVIFCFCFGNFLFYVFGIMYWI